MATPARTPRSPSLQEDSSPAKIPQRQLPRHSRSDPNLMRTRLTSIRPLSVVGEEITAATNEATAATAINNTLNINTGSSNRHLDLLAAGARAQQQISAARSATIRQALAPAPSIPAQEQQRLRRQASAPNLIGLLLEEPPSALSQNRHSKRGRPTFPVPPAAETRDAPRQQGLRAGIRHLVARISRKRGKKQDVEGSGGEADVVADEQQRQEVEDDDDKALAAPVASAARDRDRKLMGKRR